MFNDTSRSAFPIPELQIARGITSRWYFAARAPREPWGWFRPVMQSERPEEIKEGRGSNATVLNKEEIQAWDREHHKQTDIQWPWFYADTMLKESENDHSIPQES